MVNAPQQQQQAVALLDKPRAHDADWIALDEAALDAARVADEQRLLAELAQLQDIMRDMAALVHDQPPLDLIEADVALAEQRAIAARRELQQCAKSKRRRRRFWRRFVALLVGAAGIATAVSFVPRIRR